MQKYEDRVFVPEQLFDIKQEELSKSSKTEFKINILVSTVDQRIPRLCFYLAWRAIDFSKGYRQNYIRNLFTYSSDLDYTISNLSSGMEFSIQFVLDNPIFSEKHDQYQVVLMREQVDYNCFLDTGGATIVDSKKSDVVTAWNTWLL